MAIEITQLLAPVPLQGHRTENINVLMTQLALLETCPILRLPRSPRHQLFHQHTRSYAITSEMPNLLKRCMPEMKQRTRCIFLINHSLTDTNYFMAQSIPWKISVMIFPVYSDTLWILPQWEAYAADILCYLSLHAIGSLQDPSVKSMGLMVSQEGTKSYCCKMLLGQRASGVWAQGAVRHLLASRS